MCGRRLPSERVGSVATPDRARGVAVSGNYAYVGDSGSDLKVIDISKPDSPQIVGTNRYPICVPNTDYR